MSNSLGLNYNQALQDLNNQLEKRFVCLSLDLILKILLTAASFVGSQPSPHIVSVG